MPGKAVEMGFFDSDSKKAKKAKKAPKKEIKMERPTLFGALSGADPIPLNKGTEPERTVLHFFVH